jgi:hypothetical protein
MPTATGSANISSSSDTFLFFAGFLLFSKNCATMSNLNIKNIFIFK